MYVFNPHRNNGTRSYFSRNLWKETFCKIELDLVAKNWNYDSIDVNVLWKNIEMNIRSSLDNIATIVEKKSVKVKVEFIANLEHYKMKWTGYTSDFISILDLRIMMIVSLLRRKEIKYYEDNINKCRSNSRKMWRFLKSVLNVSGSEDRESSCIEAGDRSVRDTFNEFHVRSIDEIINSIDEPDDQFIENVINYQGETLCEFEIIGLNKLSNIVSNMGNKASGDGLLGARALKNVFSIV